MPRRILTAYERVAAWYEAAAEPPDPTEYGYPKAHWGYEHSRWNPARSGWDGTGTHTWNIVPPSYPAMTTLEDDFGRSHTVYYDPERTQVTRGQFRPELSTRPNRIEDLSPPPGLLWRGMSDEEYQEARERGYFESRGEHNIGDEQKGRTYFSTDPGQAAHYADGFAPWQWQPTFDRPGHVVGIPNLPEYPQERITGGEGETERGLPGRIPFSQMSHHYTGNPFAILPGDFDINNDNWEGTWQQGGRKSPVVYTTWEADPEFSPRIASRIASLREFIAVRGEDLYLGGLVGRLNDEFDAWWKDYEPQFAKEHGFDWNDYSATTGDTRGPLGHWPHVETFLKDRYPAAYRGHPQGIEHAQALMDTPPEPEAKKQEWKKKLPQAWWTKDQYETGPDALAKYGYDPKEVAAGMLLLHSQTHPGRASDDAWLMADVDRLHDIYRKRLQMERDRSEPPVTNETLDMSDDAMLQFLENMEDVLNDKGRAELARLRGQQKAASRIASYYDPMGEQDWNEIYGDLPEFVHRGVGVNLPDDLHRMVHDPAIPVEQRAQALLQHLTTPEARVSHWGHDSREGLGTSWSGDDGVAEDFARQSANQLTDYNQSQAGPNQDFTWGTDEDGDPVGKPGTAVMLRALRPELDDIDDDPNGDGSGMRYTYHGHGEQEVPVRGGTSMNIRGISWRPILPMFHPDYLTDPEEYTTHDFADDNWRTAATRTAYETVEGPR